MELLDVLHRIKTEMGEGRQLSADGMQLYSDRFEGASAWFTDESRSNKEAPENFTFPNPSGAGKLTCFWHGKVRSGAFRIYFEWPVVAPRERLRVAYIGPHVG